MYQTRSCASREEPEKLGSKRGAFQFYGEMCILSGQAAQNTGQIGPEMATRSPRTAPCGLF